jgi:hypothetical protein
MRYYNMKSFKKEYAALRSLVEACRAEDLVEQFEQLRKSHPEIHATLALLAIALHGEFYRLDELASRKEWRSPLIALPPAVAHALYEAARRSQMPAIPDIRDRLRRYCDLLFVDNLLRYNPTDPCPELALDDDVRSGDPIPA